MSRLTDIQARLEAITPGPWEALPAGWPCASWIVRGVRGTRDDSVFIANASADIRLLLDIARAAEVVSVSTTSPQAWRILLAALAALEGTDG